jgi:hypothetical protein
MTTKTKKLPPIYGDHLPITDFQIKRIMQNCGYNKDMKDEWVQWATADVNRTSLKSITQAQAVKILHAQTGTKPVNDDNDNWAKFDKNNSKHRVVLSLCHQAQWTINNEKYGEIVDLERLSNFLKSNLSPVKKPLLQMDNITELPKIIKAIEGIVKYKYK